jgi:hypothetical protein
MSFALQAGQETISGLLASVPSLLIGNESPGGDQDKTRPSETGENSSRGKVGGREGWLGICGAPSLVAKLTFRKTLIFGVVFETKELGRRLKGATR